MTDIIRATDCLDHVQCRAEVAKGVLGFSRTHSTYLFSPHQGSSLTFFLLIHSIVPFS